ncbi:MAG: hypothetical protein ACO3A4_12010 [Silvanigrellaceae bacterium]
MRLGNKCGVEPENMWLVPPTPQNSSGNENQWMCDKQDRVKPLLACVAQFCVNPFVFGHEQA